MDKSGRSLLVALIVIAGAMTAGRAADWTSVYDEHAKDSAVAVAIDASGNTYVLGNVMDVTTPTIAVVKYDNAGSEVVDWEFTFEPGGIQSVRAIGFVVHVDDESNLASIYVAGECTEENRGRQFLVLRLLETDQTSVEQSWVRTAGTNSVYDDVPSAISIAPDGSFVAVVGTSDTMINNDEHRDYSFLSVDAQGQQSWWRWNLSRIRAIPKDSATAVAIGSDGFIYATGRVHDEGDFTGYVFGTTNSGDTIPNYHLTASDNYPEASTS